jgi:hypothetical protein
MRVRLDLSQSRSPQTCSPGRAGCRSQTGDAGCDHGVGSERGLGVQVTSPFLPLLAPGSLLGADFSSGRGRSARSLLTRVCAAHLINPELSTATPALSKGPQRCNYTVIKNQRFSNLRPRVRKSGRVGAANNLGKPLQRKQLSRLRSLGIGVLHKDVHRFGGAIASQRATPGGAPLWNTGISLWEKLNDTFVAPSNPGSLSKKYRLGACRGGTGP